MTTTIDAIIKRVFDLLPLDTFGRAVPVTALATGSVTASSLSYGGQTDAKYAQKYLWRPNSATDADRVRYSTSWTQATGLIAHGGTNYADTTITGETLLICMDDPYWLRRLCNEIVQRMQEYDETIIPLVSGQREYWLHGLPWITEPADIHELWYTKSPVITKNRYLQKRHTVSIAGVLQPDDWTVTSNGDSTPWTATNYRGQRYYYRLERAGGTDAILEQVVGALRSGVSGDYPSGETITIVAVCSVGGAGDLSLYVEDVGGSASSTGSGTGLQTITASITLNSAATDITAKIIAQTTNNDHAIYELYALIGTLTDEVRRDNYERYPIPRDWITFQQGAPLKIRLPDSVGAPGQLIVGSNRPYPAFDATRLGTGAADTDETDADEVTAATGVIYKIYEAKAAGDTKSADWVRAAEWKARFESLCNRHMYVKTPEKGGFNVFNSPLAMGPVGPS